MRFRHSLVRAIAALSCLGALSYSGMAAAHLFDSKNAAEQYAKKIPELKAKSDAGDYAAAMTLAEIYTAGVGYRKRNFFYFDIESGGGAYAGTHPVFLVKPDPKLLRSFLQQLSSKGDPWASLQLAGFYSRPTKIFWFGGEGEIILRPGTENDNKWVSRAFPSDPELANTLYAKVAAPAVEIIGGDINAVYVGNNAVPASQQEQFVTQEHGAVADALGQLARNNVTGGSTGSPDWQLAYQEYHQLMSLIAASSFKGNLRNFSEAREYALLESADLLRQGGHGLTANCPEALKQLTDHAKGFPDELASHIRDGIDRGRIVGRMRSMIGLIYYKGCPGSQGVPADRDKAFTWLNYAQFDLTPDALGALAYLLDTGTPHHPPDPKEAFEAYWLALSYPSDTLPPGKITLRVAQMIEAGPVYTRIELARAKFFYCRSAQEYREPAAIKWLEAHPGEKC
ncbi:hypothetical protein [Paraburkholderia adhaesiva]|uniref:hypothetical protein n=1 Tax=Paraburkholderia adhaesiva TaxID=2883244 RepID=UPI001F3DCAB1|nr:hypothetical protein [Paraburkholderia adhaesiva]